MTDRFKTVITLGHGGGGLLTGRLVRDLFQPSFRNPHLEELGDAAVLELDTAKLAVTTDSYVVSPLFFPGGDIGRLAVCGTVNDLAVSGAIPEFMACSFIIEEGFSIADLNRVTRSIADAAREVGVVIVTGDTKVVQQGRGDGLYLTTTGLGRMRRLPASWGRIQPGDCVIVSGSIGNHGAAVLAARGNLMEGEDLVSDCAPVHDLCARLFESGLSLRWMRDPTRGGLAAALNEIAAGRDWGIVLEETAIPVSSPVRAIQQILGIDPLETACEGRVVTIVGAESADEAVRIMRSHPLGADAAIIGKVKEHLDGLVLLRTSLGGERIVDMPLGEQLPRIC